MITVTLPATTANLGPGFDSIGLALSLRNRFTLNLGGEPGTIEVETIGEGCELAREGRNESGCFDDDQRDLARDDAHGPRDSDSMREQYPSGIRIGVFLHCGFGGIDFCQYIGGKGDSPRGCRSRP